MMAGVLGALVIPGLIAFYLIQGQTQDPYEEYLREGAAMRGIDPDKVVLLNKLESQITSGQTTDQTWAEMEVLRQDSNPDLRGDVYGIAALAYKTNSQDKAVDFIRKIKDDRDSSVRSGYGWNMMLVGAPDWKQVCEEQLKSSDPEAQRSSKLALEKGPELGR